MMKVCVYARSSYSVFAPMIFSKLKETHQDVQVLYTVQNEKEKRTVLKHDATAEVKNVSEYFREHWDEFTLDIISQYEKKYSCDSIWSIVYTDRFLVEHDHEYALKICAGYFSLYESIFKDGNYDFYFDETVALASSLIATIVANYYGVEYIAPMVARGFDSTHMYFTHDKYQLFPGMEGPFTGEYPKEIVTAAEKYLSDFEEKLVKPVTMQYTGRRPEFRKGFLLAPFRYWKAKKSADNNNLYDYISYHQAKDLLNLTHFYFRYLKCRKYYRQPNISKKYVYYPLHYQPEASTLICAPKYEKQIHYIDWLAKSLPADTLLYVKEHYALLGHRKIEFYKELQNYPNVVIVDPWFESKTLIQNAEAVTTMTGTAGWEAMLLRKPVLLAGNIFFKSAPGVLDSEDIYHRYREIMASWKQPSRDEIVEYICKYLSLIRKGSVSPVNPATFSVDNIKDLADATWTEMNKGVLK